jgi:hypothetical protein
VVASGIDWAGVSSENIETTAIATRATRTTVAPAPKRRTFLFFFLVDESKRGATSAIGGVGSNAEAIDPGANPGTVGEPPPNIGDTGDVPATDGDTGDAPPNTGDTGAVPTTDGDAGAIPTADGGDAGAIPIAVGDDAGAIPIAVGDAGVLGVSGCAAFSCCEAGGFEIVVLTLMISTSSSIVCVVETASDGSLADSFPDSSSSLRCAILPTMAAKL